MANRKFDFKQAIGRSNREVSGSFAPNGNSALVAANTYGQGFTVAYTSTGLYTITLLNGYGQLQSATCSLQLATGDDKYLQFGVYDATTNAAAPTITIRCWDASAAAVADIAADTNNRIHFCLTFNDRLIVA